MFENLIEILKANPRKIVYTEGHDARILESAARLKKGGFLTPVLVGILCTRFLLRLTSTSHPRP